MVRSILQIQLRSLEAAQNAAPTDIALSNTSIAENASSLTIGSLTTTDDGSSVTYSLSGTDASKFTISSQSVLSLIAQPDYETQSSYTITITATDSGGKTYAEAFTITVTDIDENVYAPVISVTDQTSIAENVSQAVVASVSASDKEDGSVALSLSGNGSDDSLFEIVDGKLRIKASADYETKNVTMFSSRRLMQVAIQVTRV